MQEAHPSEGKRRKETGVLTSSRLSELIAFIHSNDSSLESIAQYLVVETLSDLSPVGIFLGIPQVDGSPVISCGFGVSGKMQTNEIFDMVASLVRPFQSSQNKNGLVHFSKAEILEANRGRSGKKSIFPLGFAYAIESPMSYVERGIIFFNVEPTISQDMEIFMQSVGTIVASYHSEILILQNKANVIGSPLVTPEASGGKGDKGDKGEKGSSGDKGEKGSSGDTGQKGSAGDKGEKGSAGDKGEKGSAGETGQKGGAGGKGGVDTEETVGDLTTRQLVILAEIRRGKSNAAIAKDLDYSESLIRQETIVIYRKMGVSGREALIHTEQ